MSPRILVLPGSLRAMSFNRRLAAEAARTLSSTSAEVTLLNLADYPLPIFDGDVEEAGGIPDNAVLLARQVALQDGLLLVSPEYNASVAPLLKNAIDWVSRVRKVKGRPIEPFRRLIVGLASASTGHLGGLRGLAALRPICQALGAETLAAQMTLAKAADAFDENGRLRDADAQIALDRLVDALLDHSRSLGRHLS